MWTLHRLYIWFQAFHQMLEPGCRDLFPFNHKSITVVRPLTVSQALSSNFNVPVLGGGGGTVASTAASQ